MRKKLLATLMMLAMVVSMAPLEVLALEDFDREIEQVEQKVDEATYVDASVTFNASNCDITVNWSNMETSDYYLIQKNNDTAEVVTGTSKKYTGLEKGKVYTFTVKSCEAEGANPGAPQVKKVFASQLKATAVDEDTVALTWDSATGVKVDVYKDTNRVAQNVENGTYTVNGLTCGKTYKFAVKTDDCEVAINGASAYMGQVTGLKTVSSCNSVILKWDKLEGATGYIVERNGVQVAKVADADTETFTTRVAASSGPNYTFRVYALKNDVKSSVCAAATDGAVRTVYYTVKFRKNKTLKAHDGSKVKYNFKKGQTVTAFAFKSGKYQFYGPNGHLYYVMRVNTKSQKAQAVSAPMYTKEEAESFVNTLGVASAKPYLVWVNAYTQMEYIFTGYAGHWTCVNGNGWQISTGKPSTPSATGQTKIKHKVKKRNGIKYWNVCSVYSIHSKRAKWVLGYPKSGGCVRNTEDHAAWIYNTLPKKSAVYLF